MGCVIDGSSSSLWPLIRGEGRGGEEEERGGEGEGKGGERREGEGRGAIGQCRQCTVSGGLPSPKADQIHNHVLLELCPIINGNLACTHHILHLELESTQGSITQDHTH